MHLSILFSVSWAGNLLLKYNLIEGTKCIHCNIYSMYGLNTTSEYTTTPLYSKGKTLNTHNFASTIYWWSSSQKENVKNVSFLSINKTQRSPGKCGDHPRCRKWPWQFICHISIFPFYISKWYLKCFHKIFIEIFL